MDQDPNNRYTMNVTLTTEDESIDDMDDCSFEIDDPQGRTPRELVVIAQEAAVAALRAAGATVHGICY